MKRKRYTEEQIVSFPRKLPRATDKSKVELSGMLRPGGSHEEVTIHRDPNRFDPQTG